MVKVAETGSKGPDNNRRLAFLEEQAALLSASLQDMGLVGAGAGSPMADAIVHLRDITAERDALKAKLARADKTPRAKAASAAKARKVGPVQISVEPRLLLELIRDAELVEVAFSDGKSELAGIPALEISGAAWTVKSSGLALCMDEVLLHGPGHGQPGFALAGYGLLLDDVLVAYRHRDAPLQIGAGQRWNLAGDVIF